MVFGTSSSGMSDRRDMWSLFSLFVIAASLHGAADAATGRKTVAASSGAGVSSPYLPVAEGPYIESSVEYVNDGPLGPVYDVLIRYRLYRLCNLLRKANLESILTDSGSWTIFAPTDGSFAFLPGGTLEELERNPTLLQQFLLHHFVSGDLQSSQITNEMVVDSVQGYPLRFNVYGNVITVSGAEILRPDLQFELGRVHIIDRPLYPLPVTDIIGYLQTTHKEFYRLVLLAGLADFLSSGTYTLIIPEDKAFDYLSIELKDALATNATLAYDVVLLHVIPSTVFVRGITNGTRIQSVSGVDLTFTQRRGLTFVNGIPIIIPDIPVNNGVVHVINRVLLPEGIDADCNCKPLDSQKPGATPRPSGPGQRRPFEPARLRPTPAPAVPGSGPRGTATGPGAGPVPGLPRPAPGIRPGHQQPAGPGSRPGRPQAPVPGRQTPGTQTTFPREPSPVVPQGRRPAVPPAPAPRRPGSPSQPGIPATSPVGTVPAAPAPAPGVPGAPSPVPGRPGFPSSVPGVPRAPSPAPGRPVAPASVPGRPGYPAPAPGVPGRPGFPAPVPGRPGYPAPAPGRPGAPAQIPGAPGPQAPVPGRPGVPRPSPGRIPVSPPRAGAGIRTPAPEDTVTTQTPFSPGRISQTPVLTDRVDEIPQRPHTQRPRIPGDVLIVDLGEDEPETQPDQPAVPGFTQPGRPSSRQPPGTRPGIRPQQPRPQFQTTRRPQPGRPGYVSPPLVDNTVDDGDQGFPLEQEVYQPSDITRQRPAGPAGVQQRPVQPQFQPGRGQQPARPGQQPQFQPGRGQQPTGPGQQPQFQPGRGQQPVRPGQQPQFQPGYGQQPARPGQQPQIQPGRGQQPTGPGQQPVRPGQQPQFQPGRGQQPTGPGLQPAGPGQQPQFQPGRGQQPTGPGQQPAGPGQQPQFQPGRGQHPTGPGLQPAGPGQQPQFQPGRGQQPTGPGLQPAGPGQQPQFQPGRGQQPTGPGQQPARPGQQPQFQPGRGQQPVIPGQQPSRIGQQPESQPTQPHHRQPQPGSRPGQQTPFQPTQRPGLQTPQISPAGPGQGRPVQRPGQQGPFHPGQQVPTAPVPGQPSPLQPSPPGGQQSVLTAGQPQQPSQRGQVPGFQPGVPSSRPGVSPGRFSRPTAPPRAPGSSRFTSPTSGSRQQPVTPRTSLFPTQRPGTRTSHSTKGQPFDPQRHRPAGRIPATSSARQTSPNPSSRGQTSPRQPAAPSLQASNCRRRGDRITNANRRLPLCPTPDESDVTSCQTLDQNYDPNDPRPPCDDTYSYCRYPDELADPTDTRPLCPDVQEQPGCRNPSQPSDPSDPRPVCPGTAQPPSPPNCRQPHERIVPGDRRPVCRGTPQNIPPSQGIRPQGPRGQNPGFTQPSGPAGGQPSPQAPSQPGTQGCRQPGEFSAPGDNRPLCTGSEPQSPGQIPQRPGTGRSPVGQPAPPSPALGGSTSCRRLGERPYPGDRRPACTGTQAQPGSHDIPASLPDAQDGQLPGLPEQPFDSQRAINQPQGPSDTSSCRQVGERPSPGDRRPLCSPSAGGSFQAQAPGIAPGSPHGGNRPQVPGFQTTRRPESGQRVTGPRQPGQSTPGRQPWSPGNQDVNPEVIAQDNQNPPPSGNQPTAPQHPGPGRQPVRGFQTTRRPSSQTVQRINTQQPGRPTPGSPGPDDQVPPGSQWDDSRRLTGSGQPGPPGSAPARPPSPASRPQTPQRGTPAARPGSPAIPPAPPRSRPGTSISSTTPGSSGNGPRLLYEIVEDPALLIQGRPVKLTKIFELFQKAGLDYILSDAGPYTVFLPSDDAFLRLPKGVIEQLEANPELLRQVLMFHVTSGEVLPSRQDESYSLPTLQGNNVLITMLNGGRLILISGAKAVAVTRGSNGIFYVINQLMYPLPQDDIVSALQTRPDLTQLSTFVEIAGLRDVLAGNQPYTIFAPTDNAFSQLPEAALQELTQNATALRELLLGHIIEGAHYGREFLVGKTFPNLRGEKLKLQVVSFGYQVNEVNIKTPEIVTGTGVIHMIDNVLLSPQDTIFIEGFQNTIDGVNGASRHGSHAPLVGLYPQGGSPTSGSGSPSSSTGGVLISFTQGVHGSGQQNPPSNPQVTSFTSTSQHSSSFGHRSSTVHTSSMTSTSSFTSQGNQNSLPAGPGLSQANNQNRPSSQTATYPAGQYSGVAQLANDIGLRRFAAWLTSSGLSDKIQDGGTYTILAPTDEALNALPPDVAGALDAAPNQVLDLLRYHILPQKLSADSLRNDETASTLLQGSRLRFNVYHNGQVVTALGVPVEESRGDSSSSSIRLIVVNRVLQPPSGNLLKVVESSPELTEFLAAVKKAHLNWMLNGESGKTLFAPSNVAFQSLTEDERKNMIENKQAFAELLKRHMIRGTVFASGFEDGAQRRTENNKQITFTVNENGYAVNSVPIVYADITATNGVVHIIDQFL